MPYRVDKGDQIRPAGIIAIDLRVVFGGEDIVEDCVHNLASWRHSLLTEVAHHHLLAYLDLVTRATYVTISAFMTSGEWRYLCLRFQKPCSICCRLTVETEQCMPCEICQSAKPSSHTLQRRPTSKERDVVARLCNERAWRETTVQYSRNTFKLR